MTSAVHMALASRRRVRPMLLGGWEEPGGPVVSLEAAAASQLASIPDGPGALNHFSLFARVWEISNHVMGWLSSWRCGGGPWVAEWL
jgi:hypothetical protein